MATANTVLCYEITGTNPTTGFPMIRVVGLVELSDASQCNLLMPTGTSYMQLKTTSSNFMEWFNFDTTDALGFFAVGLTLWALGIKIGAVVRTIFYTRR
jgi:hypothetical protein